MILIDDLKLTDIAAVSTLDDATTKWIYEAIDYVLKGRNSIINRELKKLEIIDLMNEQEINILFAVFPAASLYLRYCFTAKWFGFSFSSASKI